MKEEITFEEIAQKNGDEYLIVDIRDQSAFEYGHIPGSVNIPREKITEITPPTGKELYICCRSGQISAEVAGELREKGYAAYNLQGGYVEWLRRHITELSDGETAEKVERSIIKKYHKKLFSKFAKAIVNYRLIEENDKIAVCISGGKDSFLMAKLFQELQKHRKFNFDLVFLVMDPGYSKENREVIERNALTLRIPITVFETDIFENVFLKKIFIFLGRRV